MGQINLNSANPAPPSGLTNVGVQAVANPSVLAITAVTNNGGNCEIAFSSAHNCVTGDEAFINSQAFPALQGQWLLTKIDSTHLVLQGSVYASGYAGGATFLAARDFSFYMPDMVGDDVGSPPTSGGVSGAVPAPAAGDYAAGKFLAANGEWEVPAGSGLTLQTNGTNNSSQTLQNLEAGANVTLTDLGGGAIQIAASGGGGGPTITAPVSANWTAFNTSGMSQAPTYASSRYTFVSATSAGGGGNQVGGVATAIPSAPYTRTFRIWPFVGGKAYSGAGVGWADGSVGSPGKLVFLFFVCNGSSGGGSAGPVQLSGWNMSNTNSYSSGLSFSYPIAGANVAYGSPVWIKLTDDGTNWSASVSWDSTNGTNGNWLQFMQEARNTYLTATQLFVGVNYSAAQSAIVFDSYQ